MIDYPKTLVEAQVYRYNRWGGNPDGDEYTEGNCVYELYLTDPDPSFIQCQRKNGHGPAGLYCWQHAKMVTRSLDK